MFCLTGYAVLLGKKNKNISGSSKAIKPSHEKLSLEVRETEHPLVQMYNSN